MNKCESKSSRTDVGSWNGVWFEAETLRQTSLRFIWSGFFSLKKVVLKLEHFETNLESKPGKIAKLFRVYSHTQKNTPEFHNKGIFLLNTTWLPSFGDKYLRTCCATQSLSLLFYSTGIFKGWCPGVCTSCHYPLVGKIKKWMQKWTQRFSLWHHYTCKFSSHNFCDLSHAAYMRKINITSRETGSIPSTAYKTPRPRRSAHKFCPLQIQWRPFPIIDGPDWEK